MEFSTHYISFLNNISKENLEMTESTAFHVDLPSAKIREKDVWKIENYVVCAPCYQTYSNLLKQKPE